MADIELLRSAPLVRTWPFCPICSTTVAVDSSGSVRCPSCSFVTSLSSIPLSSLTITTVSNDTVIPNWAKSDEEQKLLEEANDAGKFSNLYIKCFYYSFTIF